MSTTSDPSLDYDAVVIGAGMAGLYAVYRLRECGYRIRAYEAADDIGGTWFWNKYPGARCDIPTLAYSYSFSEDLHAEWEWTEKHSTQPEILSYLEHVADRFDLRRDIQFGTKVTAATFEPDDHVWAVETDQGDAIRCRYVVSAVGCVSIPIYPDVPGVDDYEGEAYHTSRWPDHEVSFEGKSVAVIGTGSSGIQVVPEVAKVADQLVVFQRTACYSLPASNRLLDDEERGIMRSRDGYKEYFSAGRQSWFGVPRPFPTKSALEVSAEERNAAFEDGWQEGGFTMMTKFADLASSEEANDLAAEFVRDKIRAKVKDPEVTEMLLPRSFPIGTKRLCLDTGYYEAFNQDNVRLVDLRATPIDRVTASGLDTSDESFDFDLIVYATGFDAITGGLNRIEIRNPEHGVLRDFWSEGPRTYLGLASAGFPNLFMITGPGSPSVLSNMMASIEDHVDWIAEFIQHLEDSGYTAAVPTQAAQDEWVQHVHDWASFTLFPKAASWYTGANVPGKPRVFMPYVGGVAAYGAKLREVVEAGYEGFTLDTAQRQKVEAAT